MKQEDIIKGFNSYLEQERSSRNIKAKGHIVLQKQIVPHPTFKVFKTYSYIIWFYSNKEAQELHKIQLTEKVSDGKEDTILSKLNTELAQYLFSIINTPTFNKLLNGEYICT